MTHDYQGTNTTPGISRREFLQLAGSATLGLLAAGCQPDIPRVTEASTSVTSLPRASYASTQVAIGKVKTYDRKDVQDLLDDMITKLGGLGDVVKPGDSVAIKPNLTGGTHSGRWINQAPIETFVTHPEVIRALVNQVRRAGAKEIYIVEAVYEWESYSEWGYEEMARELGVTLIDLNSPKPYADFVDAAVGADSYIYPSFVFNKLLTEINVFMSVSKLKNHYYAGVTHTMKNLFGLAPLQFYRSSDSETYRSGFHGRVSETRTRMPRVILDLNRARPIHFSLIDGIKTITGGEGPWISGTNTIEPGVLVAGKNCVATDAVATAVMGHDPMGEYPKAPYLRADNHLNLAAAKGLGTNQLEEIQVVGETIDAARVQFRNG